MKKILKFMVVALFCVSMFALSPSINAISEGRQDESAYADVRLDSVAAPSSTGGNMTVKCSLSQSISSRKMVNMQYRKFNLFDGLMLNEFPFSETELNTYNNLGMICDDKETSLLFKIQFGCTDYNELKDYDANKPSVPKDTVSAINLYDIWQIQQSTPGPENSTQALVIQIHFDGTSMELIFKGDNVDDSRYNIAIDVNQTMILRFKAGLLFPSGVMIKEDVTFKYNPAVGNWFNITAGDNSDETFTDETLDNQGGYTPDEIEELKNAAKEVE